MICSLTNERLLDYVINQLNTFFPDENDISKELIRHSFDIALKRLEFCFRPIKIPGYKKDGETYFNHLHTDQYTQFLYFLGNQIWLDGGDEKICSKLVNLIRIISGMFVTYKCKLPKIFVFYHADGSVIGNADYSDYLVVFQNVTINTALDQNGETAPKIGKGVFFGTGAKLIGNQSIGDRVSIGANVCIYNQKIPADAVVTNENNKITIRKRKKKECLVQQFFLDKI